MRGGTEIETVAAEGDGTSRGWAEELRKKDKRARQISCPLSGRGRFGVETIEADPDVVGVGLLSPKLFSPQPLTTLRTQCSYTVAFWVWLN